MIMLREEVQEHGFLTWRSPSDLEGHAAGQAIDSGGNGEVGPNGFDIGYMENGNLVEWIPDEEHPGDECPLLLRRNDGAISEAYKELWDKVWWHLNHEWLERTENRAEPPTPTEKQDSSLQEMKEKARQIEEKHGRENLECGDYKWGLLFGRMSALFWVLGGDWDEPLEILGLG